MSRARTWREVRAQAIGEGRITEEGIARARDGAGRLCGAADGLGLDPDDPEPFGRCSLPARHEGQWHQEWRDGRLWAEWRGPRRG